MKFFRKYRTAISLLIWALLSTAVLIIWNVNRQRLQDTMENKVRTTSSLVLDQFSEVLRDNVNRLENLKRRLEMTEGAYFVYWNDDASQIIKQEPSFKFVEWIDSTGVIQRVVPSRENEKAIGLDISQLEYRESDWHKARYDSTFNLTHWLELVQGDFAFLVDAPVYINGEFYGTITAGMDFTTYFDEIMRGLDDYHVEIRDERGKMFYRHGSTAETESLEYLMTQNRIQINDASNTIWTVTMVPNQLFLEANVPIGNTIILILSLLFCMLIAVSYFFMQKSFAAEESYRNANLKLRALIDSAPIGIYVINAEGRVLDFWNEAAEQMLGWKREEVLGNLHPVLERVDPDEFNRIMKRTLERGELKNQIVKRRRRDGSEGIFRLNIGNIVGEEQQMLVLLEDITKKKEYEHRLEQSINEKEILLAEVHHRVKNNLAIIVGLIELQKDGVTDEHSLALLNETKNRIYSISEVHELLYESESFTRISFRTYFDRLIQKLKQVYEAYNPQFNITNHIERFTININQAVSLGLLLNELITNSFKHAFEDVNQAVISIDFYEEDGLIEIVYRDNGKGLDEFDFEDEDSLGMVLISTLLTQLSADYDLLDGPGFGIRFKFQAINQGAQSSL